MVPEVEDGVCAIFGAMVVDYMGLSIENELSLSRRAMEVSMEGVWISKAVLMESISMCFQYAKFAVPEYLGAWVRHSRYPPVNIKIALTL